MKRKYIRINTTVKEILKETPTIDNVALILEIWKREGLKLTAGQKGFILQCSSPESITRSKRSCKKKKKK